MSNGNLRSSADDQGAAPNTPQVSRVRAFAGIVVVIVFIGAAIVAIVRQRHEFAAAIRDIGVGGLLGSFGLGLLGVGLTFPVWRTVLRGLGVDLGRDESGGVFFTSQLGKYVPGSVWPVIMQMEAGRSRGAPRRTMLAANVITVVLGCTVGLALACALLPWSNGHALARYWVLLLALPFLFALLHPRAVPVVLNRVLGWIGREPLAQHLPVAASARASLWSVGSFLALGGHVAVLVLAINGGGLATVVLCTGGMALAVSAGVLFVPAPAGAGIRDVILAFVLGATLNSGQALAVVVASRGMLIGVDAVLAGLVMAYRFVTHGRDANQPGRLG